MMIVSVTPSVNTDGIAELSIFCQSHFWEIGSVTATSEFGGSLRLMCSRMVALSGSETVSAGSAAACSKKELASAGSSEVELTATPGPAGSVANFGVKTDARKYPAESHANRPVRTTCEITVARSKFTNWLANA